MNRRILENVPLSPFTTLGIGGPARFLARAKTEEDVLEALDFARARGCPVFILGGGSNILVSDSGFPGLVIKIEIEGIEGQDQEGIISVAAGVGWDSCVQYCVAHGLAGIECLSGIPGTVGGAPVQNIAAYGQEIRDVLLKVCVLDRETSRVLTLENADCRFAYRSSIFNTAFKDRYVILRVDLKLSPSAPRLPLHADLKDRLAVRASSLTVEDIRAAVLETRREKSMLINEKDPNARSAGSFFKNPVFDSDFVSRLEEQARIKGVLGASESMPRFEDDGGMQKVPAAWLIERAGFHKGYVHKNAGISSKHALAIINRGGATGQEVLELMTLIREGVHRVFGVQLQPEVSFVGFDKPDIGIAC